MGASQKLNQNAMKYIHIIIMFVIWFVVKSLPPFAGITEMGMAILGITLALLYGWIMVDLLWPSLFGFVLLQLSGYTTILGGLAAGIGNQSVLMVFILLAFAAGISQLGVSDMIASWLMQRKIFIGRPLVMVFGLLYGALIISVAGGGVASIFLVWDLLNSIMRANGRPTNDTVAGVLKALILYNGMVGFILPWQNTIYLFGGFWQKGAPGLELPTMGVMYCGIIWALLANVLMVFACKYIFKLDFSGFLITEEIMEQFKGKDVTIYQKAGLIGMGIYIVLLLFASIFKTNAAAAFINLLGVTGLSIIFMTIFSIWKKPNGKPVMDVAECFRQTPWAVIMLLAITIPLGDALQSGDTGIMAAITKVVYPLVSGMGATMFTIVCMVALIILTQFLHNVICGAVLLPMLTPICITMGGDPYLFLFMCFTALMSAYATPAASMFSGLVFGMPDITNKSAYLAGWLYVVVTIVILTALMPLWSVIFGALY